ncbi:MAG: hypothetical protein KDA24_28200 [Deltaproteobacteria bacterium]|nr:hypothetical protein [Deltaproteobacteria bacterium]
MRGLLALLLLLPTALADTGEVEEIPVGSILYLDAAACPEGWTEPFELRGRIVVGVTSNNAIGDTYGDPLEAGEDRLHGHAVTGEISVPSESVALASGGSNGIGGNGTFAVTGTAEPVSTGLPTVALRACRRGN